MKIVKDKKNKVEVSKESTKKAIEEVYQKKSPLEHILLRPV
jgi:hypothetical protein